MRTNNIKIFIFIMLLLQTQIFLLEKDACAIDKHADSEILQGEWDLIEIHSARGDVKGDPINGFTLFIEKNNFVYKKDGIAVGTATIFHLDPSRVPKLIVLEVIDGDAKGSKREGIYELDDNVFKFNLSRKGRDIPTTIEPKKGEGQSLAIYKRKSRKSR